MVYIVKAKNRLAYGSPVHKIVTNSCCDEKGQFLTTFCVCFSSHEIKVSSEKYFYFKKCLEICHDFCIPFWDIYLPILTHFGPFLIILTSRKVFCSLVGLTKCLAILLVLLLILLLVQFLGVYTSGVQ